MRLRLDVYHHFEAGRVDRTLDRLSTQMEQLMTTAADLNAKLDRINAATNNLAADLRGLKDQIGTGMSQADVEAVSTRLESTAAALEALAAETPDVPQTPA